MPDNPAPPAAVEPPAETPAAVPPVPAEVPVGGRGFKPPSNLNPKEERESQTARTLALTLVWVLVGVFVIHYGLLTILGISHAQAIPSLEHVFNSAFPVFSGLVGTAVGFYLKERKG